MEQVYKAIWTKFSETPNNTFYTSIGGRLYTENSVPQETTSPYATYSILPAANADNFRTTIYDTIIQFRVFSDDPSLLECVRILEKCQTVFDKIDISPTSVYCRFKMVRGNMSPPYKDAEDDFREWQGMIDFNALIQKG